MLNSMGFAGVKKVTDGMTDQELAGFYYSLWSSDPRQVCENSPWFHKVEDLFTEAGGKTIHPTTRDAVTKIFNHRILKI